MSGSDLVEWGAAVERALQLFRTGKPASSLEVLGPVRRRLQSAYDSGRQETAELLATALMREAAPRFDVSGDLPLALGLVDEAAAVAKSSGSVDLEAKIRGQRALVILRSGDTRAALRAFDFAVELLDDASLTDRCTILINRGVLHLEAVRLEAAAADFRDSLSFAMQGEGREFENLRGISRQNIAYVDFLAGRIPAALAGLQEAAVDYGDDPHPTSYLDRARVLREAGLFQDAAIILAEASTRFLREKLFQDLGETELVRAECALVEGEVKQARELATAAERRFARRNNLRWQRKAELLVLRCDDALAETKTGAARRTALRRIVERASSFAQDCRREGRRDLARMAELLGAEARLRLGEELTGTIPRQRPTDPLQVRLQTREVRALAELNAGRASAAANEIRQGLNELGSYQHALGSLDLRTASAVHGSSLARLGLRIAFDSGSPAAVLKLVEHARAVSTRLPAVRPPSDERTASLLVELRQAEEEARALEGESTGADSLAALRSRIALLQRDIRARSWEIEADQGVAEKAPTLAEIGAAATAANTAFVTFARHAGRWVAVVVRGRRSSLHDLAEIKEVSGLLQRVRADLDALAQPRLPDQIRAAIRSSFDLGVRRLEDLLLEPLGVRDVPLVLSASGDLVLVPWGLLPGRLGVATVVTPSAASWLRSQQATRPAKPNVATISGPDLLRSQEEAEIVGALWGASTILVGEAATSAQTKAILEDFDLVHVAAHGTHRQDNPLFSSVRLADGALYAYEVDAAVGLASCVVLSACEAGLATLRPGDESLGLTHVLLQFGARCVISGVARVGDETASRVMEHVHRSMAAGVDSASALAAAQAASLDHGSPAGFVTFGSTW